LKEQILEFETLLLMLLPSAQPRSSVSCEQNGYYAAQHFCVIELIKIELGTAVQRAFPRRFNSEPYHAAPQSPTRFY
jgi:hypothetical protein